MNNMRQILAERQAGRVGRGPARLRIAPAQVLGWHLAAVALLLAGHLGAALLQIGFGRGETLWRLLFLGGEGNLPSFLSAAALLAAGLIAFLLSRIDDPANATPWRLAGLILLFLCLDEAAGLHEQLKWLAPRVKGELSLFWLLPYGALVLAVVAILLPFWLRLPAGARIGLAGSALMFVGGAMGMELVEGRLYEDRADAYLRWPMVVSVAVEEVLEMAAVALLIFTMLRHAAGRRQPVLVMDVAA